MRILYFFVFVLFLFQPFAALSESWELAKTGEYQAIYPLADEAAPNFLAYKEQAGNKTISLLKISDNKLSVVGETSAFGNPWEACTVNIGSIKGYAVAYGYGRGNLQAPISVFLYDDKLSNPKLIFEVTSERSEIKFLRQVGNSQVGKGQVGSALNINYFDSKYYTTLVKLESSEIGKPWKQTKLQQVRLGTSTVVAGQTLFLGRPYGDKQGQDGDVLMFEGGKQTTLPTYRGVNAMLSLEPSSSRPNLIIADGWQQRYAELAEGRISLLTYDAKAKRYSLELLDRILTQFQFSRLLRVGANVLAVGNSAAFVFRSDKNWERVDFYAQTQTANAFYALPVVDTSSKLKIVVLDGELKLFDSP